MISIAWSFGTQRGVIFDFQTPFFIVFTALCWVMKKNDFNDASCEVNLMPKDWQWLGDGW